MITRVLAKVETILDSTLQAEIETYEGLKSHIVVRSGASEEEINKCNSYFENKLPEDYLSFLKRYNGGFFFKVNDIGGFQFWGCDELIYQNTFHKENLGNDWDKRIILICACLGDGDYVGIKIHKDNSYEILDCFGEEIPINWKHIGDSFCSFLEKIIDQRGKKFWL